MRSLDVASLSTPEGRLRVLVNGRNMEVPRTANLEPLVKFGIVPIADVELCNAYVSDAALADIHQCQLLGERIS